MTETNNQITVDERLSAILHDVASIKQETLIDKHRFVELLNACFARLTVGGRESISKAQILAALDASGGSTTEESITLLIVLRYFDFISTMVDEAASDSEEEISMEPRAITKADIDTLASFLLHTEMTLEAFHQWCGGRAADDLTICTGFGGMPVSVTA